MLNDSYIIAGCISGSLANFITYPLDTLKVLKQTNTSYKFKNIYINAHNGYCS